MDLYERGTKVRKELEKLTLQELIQINPTLEEMRHVHYVMGIGHGHGVQEHGEWHIGEVEKLLEKRGALTSS